MATPHKTQTRRLQGRMDLPVTDRTDPGDVHSLPQPTTDHNVYTLGSINGHNIVISGLATTGNNSAATVVTQMRATFRRIRFCLVVSTGSGVPTRTDDGDVRLGDVVVSKPVGEHSGVIKFHHGKAEAGRFKRTGYLAPPPATLLNAAQMMAVSLEIRIGREQGDPLLENLKRVPTEGPIFQKYKFPGRSQDHLYSGTTCQEWEYQSDQRSRPVGITDAQDQDPDPQVIVHRGTIASGEWVIMDSYLRDIFAKECGALCFETEAAGALDDFPCLVIRGISDYADSHKTKQWKGYAAAVAAAYARQLFFYLPVDEVEQCMIPEKGR
ncbi:MAG: hypothetical protein M1834_007808 [Cirrosporium novae-zelandiae]|nr:MAG: hypothetical protein M1834_007808 [Cirrosporium novae-zelandiae]